MKEKHEPKIEGRYLIVPPSLYEEGVKAAKQGDRFFSLKGDILYFLGARVYIQQPLVI